MAFGAGEEGGRRQARDHVPGRDPRDQRLRADWRRARRHCLKGRWRRATPRECAGQHAPALCDAERGGACQLASCGRLQRRQERSGGAGARAQEGAGQRPREGSGAEASWGRLPRTEAEGSGRSPPPWPRGTEKGRCAQAEPQGPSLSFLDPKPSDARLVIAFYQVVHVMLCSC